MTDYADELRAAKIRLLNAEAAAKECEVEFGRLKIEEASRTLALEKAQGAESRVLTFDGEVTDDTVTKAIRVMDVWSRATPGCDIKILLTSPGGGVLAGLRFVDFVHELKDRGHKVTIKVMGYAMSMGATILQAGSERTITPNAWVLIHETQTSDLSGNFTQITEASKQIQRYQDQTLSILASRSSLSKNQIKNRWKNKDWFLNAQEALNHGFVDRIET
jgi:ATP-dependent Clp endopeptidase proteolytic subunit ClpP